MKEKSTGRKWSDFAVKNWPTHLVFLIARFISLFPLSLQYNLAKLLGRFVYCVMEWPITAKYRPRNKLASHIAKTNISLCFPELTEKECENLVKRNFVETIMGFIDMFNCWYSPDKVHAAHETEGWENLENALAQEKGVIIAGFHFTSMIVECYMLARKVPLIPLYRESRNSFLQREANRLHKRKLYDFIGGRQFRQAVKFLKANRVIWCAIDQNMGGRENIFVPFFDVQASTTCAISKYAKITGALVVPVTQHRLKNGRGWHMKVHPVIDQIPSGDYVKDASTIHKVLETHLREHPEDYLWIHHRFGHRPEGTSRVY